MVHSWAIDKDDPTEMPRWGKVGKQKIEDAGTLYPKRMETVDDEIRDFAISFMDAAKKANKPFFVWLNPTRMHIVTHLSPKWEATRNSENGWSEHEAGMAQLDNDIGLVLQKLKDIGEEDNTIVVFTTDNGTESFTWPDGGTTPFAQCKGTIMEGGFRVPCIARWPGKIPADTVQNGLMSGLDWFPTLLAAAGNPTIASDLLRGAKIGDRTYKNHLDGYNQMDMLTGKSPSARHEIFYLGESTVGECASTITSIALSTNPTAGWARKPARTCPTSPTCVSIRSNAWAGPTMGPRKAHSNTSIGSSFNSGDLSLCKKSSVSNSRPSSIIRPCSGGRVSTSTPLKRKWQKECNRPRRRAKVRATSPVPCMARGRKNPAIQHDETLLTILRYADADWQAAFGRFGEITDAASPEPKGAADQHPAAVWPLHALRAWVDAPQ